MADLLEKLWPAFVSEVTEQLDSVELLLAKSTSAKSIDINHLFRNFHTIKGNCSMIGFTSMETIAHRSEDILAAVRNNEFTMGDHVVDILLESISCLKKQFLSANTTRENPVQDEALVKKLAGFVEAQQEVKEVQVEDSEEIKKEKLAALVTSARMAVPVLVLGLDPAAKVEKVEASLLAFAEKARLLDFKALSRSLIHFIDTLKSNIEDKQNQLISQVAEIFDDITFISNKHNLDLSLDMGAKLCRSKLTPAYQEELRILSELLQNLKQHNPAEWKAEQFMALVDHAGKLSSYCSLFKLAELTATWRYIRQLVVEVARGYLVFNSAIIDKLLEIVSLTQSPEAKAGGDGAFEHSCKKSREELQSLTARHNNERDEIVNLKEEIVSKTTLCIDSLVELKMDVLNKINGAINSGMLAVEIDISFADEVISEKVLMAVRNLGELVHSRTMFHDIVNGVAQRTSFSFLILSKKSVEDINTILTIIDKSRKTFEILGFEHLFNKAKTSAAPVVPAQPESAKSEARPAAPQPVAEIDEVSETESLVSETSMSLGSLKIEGSAIDAVISDIGELITHHNALSHLITQDLFSAHISQLRAMLHDSPNGHGKEMIAFFEELHGQMNNANENLQSSLNRIQGSVLNLRVVPIAYAFNRFHKFVRTIAQKLNKKVILDVIGEQVKVDKGMIDILSEPLAHMIRNSIDHGIEPPAHRKKIGKEEFGLIKLRAEQQSGMVLIQVIDDGAGLNREAILNKCISLGMLSPDVNYSDEEVFKYIFEPGFSTSKELTETSGRGVGMDVVKSKIHEVGGSVTVVSSRGAGTTISLKLPISAAIQSVILIDNGGQTLAFPERHIVEVICINAGDIQLIQEQSAFMLRNNIVPLYRLSELISSGSSLSSYEPASDYEVVVIENDGFMIGLVVNETLGRTEVLVRDVHESIRNMPGVSSAAILGDGKVVIILDCAGLFQMALDNAQNIIGMSAAKAC